MLKHLQILVAIFLICFLCLPNSWAQKTSSSTICGMDYLHKKTMKKDKNYQAKQQLIEDNYQQKMQQFSGNASKNKKRMPHVIPTVIHVYHDGTPPLTNAQIEQGLDHINTGLTGEDCDGQMTGIDVGVQLCLARRDIHNTAISGMIIHPTDADLADHDLDTEDLLLKTANNVSDDFPSTDYLNIWIVNSIVNSATSEEISGYATYAASHGTPLDGIVIEANFWHSCNGSKVGIHELGHYLDLFHTFTDGCAYGSCLTTGDKVCDTPPDGNNNPFSDCSLIDSCPADDDGSGNPLYDLRNNYMDYGQLVCRNAFTQGQVDRMIIALEGTRSSLLSSIGCIDPCPTPVVADCIPTATTIDVGGNVLFVNNSTNADAVTWLIDDVPFSNDLSSIDYTFTTEGVYTVTLVAQNSDPTCLEDDFVIEITVVCPADATIEVAGGIVDIAVDDQVNFSANTVANSYNWYLDDFTGSPIGNLPDLTYTFSTAGLYTVYLETCTNSNGIDCCDVKSTLISVGACESQKRGAIWYFGSNAGLDFNTSPPSMITGPMYVHEGSSAISDEDGNILFYTNGETVYNASHNIMLDHLGVPVTGMNGLRGTQSPTQSSIILPNPDTSNDHIYYVFTVDGVENTQRGVHYTIVDMNGDGGLGEVTATKNVELLNHSAEKITAVKHCNGINYWVIVHSSGINIFHVFELTPSGVNMIPVLSTIGLMKPTYDGLPTGSAGQGYLKASPNGRRLAMANHDIFDNTIWPFDLDVEVFDFDNATGMITNHMILETPANSYGIEFSPNSKIVYVSSTDGILRQYDLTFSTTALIGNPMEEFPVSSTNLGALQLGIDGRIYISYAQTSALSVINFPNVAGPGCNLEIDAMETLPGSLLGIGLPNIFPGFLQPNHPDIITTTSGPCLNTPMAYHVEKENTCDAATYTWDTSQLPATTQITIGSSSIQETINLVFVESGIFTLGIEKASPCGAIYQDEVQIVVEAPPTFQWMENSETVCAGETAFFQFSTNATSATLTPLSPVGGGSTVIAGTSFTLAPTGYTCYRLTLANSSCSHIEEFCIDIIDPCCPTTVGNFNQTQAVCMSDLTTILPQDLLPTDADILATIDVPTEADIVWTPWPTTPIQYTGDKCNPQTFRYQLFIYCANDYTIPPLHGGIVNIVVYPEVDLVNNAVINDYGCGPTLDVGCQRQITVENSLDANGATPDYTGITGMGTVTFTLTNQDAIDSGLTGSCATEIITANYTCISSCPLVEASSDYQHLSSMFILDDWVGHGKYFVEDFATITVVNDVTVDLTNVDMVFGECASIIFKGSARLRANNSVFRPCDESKMWGGLIFEFKSRGTINECTFKNASTAIRIDKSAHVRITNNLFANCNKGVYASTSYINEPLTGNTFMIDEKVNLFSPSSCYSDISPDFTGVDIVHTNRNYNISQNDFTNTAEEVNYWGVRIHGGTANITQNNFTNMFRSIDLQNAFNVSIEGNEMDLNYFQLPEPTGGAVTNFDAHLHQIRVSETKGAPKGMIEIFGNTLHNTVSYADMSFSLTNFFNTAIYTDNKHNISIRNNDIKGFRTGIAMLNTSNAQIADNYIDNAYNYGIYVRNDRHRPHNINVSCNTINMNLLDGDQFTVGIAYFVNSVRKSAGIDIYSNCVFETNFALVCHDPNQNGLPLPYIRNNFFYNYRNIGFVNAGFTGNIGLDNGVYQSAGRNTFVSNNTNSIDIFSNPSIINADGNFNSNNNFGVIPLASATFNSTASCGHQFEEHLNHRPQEYIEYEVCDKFFDVVHGIKRNAHRYVLEDDFLALLEEIDAKDRFVHVLNAMGILLQNEDDIELDALYNNLINSNLLTDVEQKWLTHHYLLHKEDYTKSLTQLDNIIAHDVDEEELIFLQQLYLNSLLGNTDLLQQTTLVEKLKEIELRDGRHAAIARDYLQSLIGGHDYHFEPLIRPDFKQPAELLAEVESLDRSITLYPNPTNDQLTIVLQDWRQTYRQLHVQLYNALGQLVQQQELDIYSRQHQLSVGDLSKGIYLCQLVGDGQVVHQEKVVVLP